MVNDGQWTSSFLFFYIDSKRGSADRHFPICLKSIKRSGGLMVHVSYPYRGFGSNGSSLTSIQRSGGLMVHVSHSYRVVEVS